MNQEARQATARLLEALHRLDDMAEANIARSQQIKVRIHRLVTRLEAGEGLIDIVESEEPPPIPSLISANIEALHDVGAALRRAEAEALRAHGYSMERIAQRFGVTRQRISSLLKDRSRPIRESETQQEPSTDLADHDRGMGTDTDISG